WRRAGSGLAAAPGPDQTRPAHRRGLLVPSRHRPQRLSADGGHGPRQAGPCRHPGHGRRCAAGSRGDPQRALRAECAVPRDTITGRRHHAPISQRGAYRGRYKHKRRTWQGDLQARSAHDSRGKS
ncbi:hypothetical protein BN1723_020093, partial [Verticillium longisporum]